MANYEIRIKDGVKTWTPETVPGSQQYDGTPTTTPPTGGNVVYLATRVGKPWTPSAAKRVINFSQFGSTPSPSRYKLSCDFRPAEISHDEWRSRGIGMLSQWTSDQTGGLYPFTGVPDNQKFIYQTESALHGPLEGHGYWVATLAEIEQSYMNRINPWGAGAHWVANIETSNNWERMAYATPGQYAGWGGHWGSWDSVRNTVIQLESTLQSMTLEQFFASGLLPGERAVRKQNRMAIMLKVAARAGARVAIGSSAYQGEPRMDALQTSNRFLDEGGINVNNIGGSNGSITLNGRTYTGMNGSHYQFETFHLDYHYYFDFLYNGVIVNQDLYENPGNSQNAPYHAEKSYPAMYSRCTNRHPIAREMGHWLANRKRLMEAHGGQLIPSGRMHEIFYEDNYARIGYGMGLAPWTGVDDAPPKVWVIPYVMRIMRMVHHFLEGETDGSFFHIFHAAGSPNQGIIYNLSGINYLNHELHTMEALFAASRDMETIADKIANTTLTTDLQVKIGNTGGWQTVNGVSAYGLEPGGAYTTMTPCFATRHKTTSEGTAFLICGGMDQDWNDIRTDVIQAPGIGNGNVIELEYKGKDVQFFECLFPTGASNLTIKAKSSVLAWAKPGYGGRINQ